MLGSQTPNPEANQPGYAEIQVEAGVGEAAPESASAAPDPSAISNIVDNMLAELKPKLMEEITRKLAAEKKKE